MLLRRARRHWYKKFHGDKAVYDAIVAVRKRNKSREGKVEQ